MKMQVGLLVGLAGLVGCQSAPRDYTPPNFHKNTVQAPYPNAPKTDAPKPYSLTSSDEKTVKAGVTNSLKDPTSAIFGAMRAVKEKSGLVTVCGFVNGKNSYGGYVGQQPFVGGLIGDGNNKVFAVIGMGGTNVHTQATYQLCAQKGINL